MIVELGKIQFRYINDIDQLPVDRFMKFNKYLIINEQVGSSFSDIDSTHLSKMFRLSVDPEKLLNEMRNFRNLIYFLAENINPLSLAFACLVTEINGVPVNDTSEDGLKHTVKVLSDAGLAWDDLKKKFTLHKKPSRKMLIGSFLLRIRTKMFSFLRMKGKG